MLILNFILIFFLAAFGWLGLRGGLVRAMGALVGIGTGLWAASRLSGLVSGFVGLLFFGHYNLAFTVCFISIFVLTMRLSAFIFHLADKFLNISERQIFLKRMNRLGGLSIGILQGALILGLAMSVIIQYSWGIFLIDLIDRSGLAAFLLAVGGWLSFLLPGEVIGNP